MQFRVLGTFEVLRENLVLTPTAPKLRRVLALLVLHANSVVRTGQLVDELWAEQPPLSSATTLQTYVYQLRKLLGLAERGRAGDPAAPAPQLALRTRPAGYLLSVAPDALDRHRFESLAARGRSELAGGALASAAGTLRAALAVWRGPALADVDVGRVLHAEVVRLQESRNAVLDLCIDADLQLGHHDDVISELTALTAQEPTHEGLHARLMLALHRAGRRTEALRVFQRIRTALATDLGLEPGSQLQRMHRSVLAADPALDLPSPRVTVTPRGSAWSPGAPAQLPPDVPLVGRDEELATIERLLHRRTPTPVTVAVVGAPGAGASAFAVHAAHRVRSDFPNGQLYGNLAEPVTAAEVLGEFLRATGTPPGALPTGVSERSRLFRSWTADRRVLVVLDGVTSAAQLAPLLPSGARCATIATCARRMGDSQVSTVVHLPALQEESSLALLELVVGAERIAEDHDAAARLVQLCGGLPLALRAVATRLTLRPHWATAHLLQRLTTESRRVAELRTSTLDLLASVGTRYRLVSPAYRWALRPIAASAASSSLTVPATAAVLRTDEPAAEAILEQLAELCLLDVARPAEPAGAFAYRLHPLLRLAVLAVAQQDRAVPGRPAPPHAVRGTVAPWSGRARSGHPGRFGDGVPQP
jgi:DNA-binding SARP family transcriptional activator